MTTAQLGDSGIVLNDVDEHGVEWIIKSGSDLWGASPAPREVVGDRAVADGQWSATRYYRARTWSLSVLAIAPSHATLHHARSRLEAAVGIRPFSVTGMEDHFGARVAQFRRAGEILWAETGDTALASIPLVADDPLIHGAELLSASTSAPSSVGGLAWPATWPATWDAVVTSGTVQLANAGTVPANVLWRIDGPITDPYLIDVSTGRTLRTNLVLAAGEWLTLDTATHRVLAAGDPNASRRDRVRGDWFTAAPGVTQVQFGGSAAGPGAQLTASWRSAWI